MSKLLTLFKSEYGALRRSDLIRAGVTDVEISQNLLVGDLTRIRRGWFALAALPVEPGIHAAVKQGCAFSGAPALAKRGAWDLHDHRVFLRASRQHHNRGDAKPTVLSRGEHRYVPITTAVDPIEVAFEVSLLHLSRRDLIVVGDSLIQRDLISLTSIQQIASRYARDIRAAVASINGFAESGTETMVRLWLEENKIPFVQQFIFNENQRADFLIGKRLILEVDSVTHHTSREQQQRDHDRDQYFHSLGYIVFRVTYDDVTKNWGVVSIRLMAIIARGDHLHRPVGIAA